jgi:uncharacterized damage-inducible protein DinB
MDQAFYGPAWHGTPLWGSLRGVTAKQAMRRPAPGRNNIWDLTLHVAYWKYVIRRRITGDAAISFPRSPANWPRSDGTESAWKRDKALLKREHELLRGVVARVPEKELGRRSWKGKYTNLQHLQGIASHDLYHCGQIQLVKKLVVGG